MSRQRVIALLGVLRARQFRRAWAWANVCYWPNAGIDGAAMLNVTQEFTARER
jgi:hypothetical protein